jgi:hypothetical protein
MYQVNEIKNAALTEEVIQRYYMDSLSSVPKLIGGEHNVGMTHLGIKALRYKEGTQKNAVASKRALSEYRS